MCCATGHGLVHRYGCPTETKNMCVQRFNSGSNKYHANAILTPLMSEKSSLEKTFLKDLQFVTNFFSTFEMNFAQKRNVRQLHSCNPVFCAYRPE